MHNLERNMGRKNREENRLYSHRNFNRASENPIQAARALRIRKAINDINIYQDNLKTANMIYENAESSIMKVSSIIQSVYEHLIKGAHGGLNSEDAGIVADSIDKFAEEMVQLMNIVVADRRIFGGTNNSSLAFSITDGPAGKTANYHGVALNLYQDPNLFPFSGVSYTDIGIGLTMGRDGRVDPQSAVPVTFNGAEILGSGLAGKTTMINLDSLSDGETYSLDVSVGANRQTIVFTAGADNNATVANLNRALHARFGDRISIGAESGLVINNVAGRPEITVVNTPPRMGEPGYPPATITTTPTGFSANVIQLVLDSAQALKADERFLAAQYADALFALQTNVSLTLAKIGNTQEFIDFNMDRTTNNMMSLLEQQRDIEASKPEEQITMIKVLESIFSAQLSMGAQLIPMSIFNFIR
jgi:flagellin-like hook-associated protein FlgL